MANHNATGKKAKHGQELVQRCRAAIMSALEVIDQRGRNIVELLADEVERNPLKFMELASKFCPKDLSVEINDSERAEELSDDELAGIAAASRNRVAPTKESTH